MPLKKFAPALMFPALLSAYAGDPPTPDTTELHTAAGSSGVAEVEVLLKASADVKAKDEELRSNVAPFSMASLGSQLHNRSDGELRSNGSVEKLSVHWDRTDGRGHLGQMVSKRGWHHGSEC